ncbi:TorD/DmsD family molecular chaperone [Ferruginivarius sediminum]|uniref:TorD/DmsD family molecular chaperone n=1 Tax=Ferruginivarius sediminum TaxID=2661937 RepID=UPI001F4EBA4C|nr:molecular chaperone TorD family protein [Ferruginivarius sediminum]
MTGAVPSNDVPEEDALRANVYALLAQLLARAPDAALLDRLRNLDGDDSEFGETVRTLARVAQTATPEAVEEEYFDLFIGIGESELKPYGSYYLTGFLNEKPLARLRLDMRRLGIARAEGINEPEDHIAAVCEMMAGLITGAFSEPAGLAEQRAFYEQHLGNWAPRFFEDLEAAQRASFYMPVGALGRLFLEVENQAFDMAA